MIFHISRNTIQCRDGEISIEISSEIPLRPFDEQYYLNKYGLEMCPSDIQNYSAHLLIWEYILYHKIIKPCIIIENDIKLNISYDDIFEETQSISTNWDLIIPYNKLNQDTLIKNEIFPSRLGYYWGSYFYVVNAQNIETLLKMKKIRNLLMRKYCKGRLITL